jgi:UDP-N-acetylmuramyl pentapeptide phosphotransferase/UDP-N-acetylglucosamine-1-phosphate transferase
LCILLLLIPNLLIVGLLVFATIGFIDNWYSLRRKPA